jgi:hypothetical protein
METRTILLTVHLGAVAAWIGAELVQHVLSPRLTREPLPTAAAWARQQLWLHQRYYPVPGVLTLVTGGLLVREGAWSWSAGFVWVGIGAIVGGVVLGRGGLGASARKRIAALEAGDGEAAAAIYRRSLPLAVIVTALPILALVAMVDKWMA